MRIITEKGVSFMKQIRLIRISFLICLGIAVLTFVAGYYIGNSKRILYAAQQNNETSSLEPVGTNRAEEGSSIKSSIAVKGYGYYLKDTGDFLDVFFRDNDALYFETDLKKTDLPPELQPEVKTGIEFRTLEELYGFLESYSS